MTFSIHSTGERDPGFVAAESSAGLGAHLLGDAGQTFQASTARSEK